MTAARKTKVFLVDDHALVRQGLKGLLEAELDLTVCGEAADGPGALELIRSSKPDIALVDMGLEGMSGLELIKNVKSRHPRLPVLVISMHDESIFAERALRAGARGYLMKKESAEKVVQAVRQVLSGKIYLSEQMSEKMLGRIAYPQDSPGGSPVDALSDRELEVFQLIGQGYKTHQIADQLSLSVKTVESYREQVKAKLGLGNATDLIQYAIQWTHSEDLK